MMALIIIGIVLVVGGMLASEAVVKPMVADRIEEDLGESVQAFVDQEIAALPEPVSVPQQYFVSEAEINQRIAQQSDLGPLDDVEVEIHQDGIEIELSAYRMSGTYRAQPAASNGGVTIEDGSFSGPLSYVLPVDELERVANEAILDSLIASNMQISDVTLVEGEIVLTLEPTGAGNDPPSG